MMRKRPIYGCAGSNSNEHSQLLHRKVTFK